MREHYGRVLDPDQRAEPVQPGRVQVQRGGGPGDRGQPPGTGAQQDQGARAGLELADPRREHALKLPGQRQRLGQWFRPGQLRRTEDTGQLDERQRIARGGREQRVADGWRQRGAAPLGQECAGLIGIQPVQHPLGESSFHEAVT